MRSSVRASGPVRLNTDIIITRNTHPGGGTVELLAGFQNSKQEDDECAPLPKAVLPPTQTGFHTKDL